MQARFSVMHKGQELGPFSKDEIVQKIKTHEFSLLDFVYDEDQSDWVPLGDLFPTAVQPATAGPGRPPIAPPLPAEATLIGKNPLLGDTKPTMRPPPPSPESKKTQEPASAPVAAPSAGATAAPTAAPVAATAASSAVGAVQASNVVPLSPAKPAPASAQPQGAGGAGGSASAAETKTGTITLKDGVGFIELLQYSAGVVKLNLFEDKKLGIQTAQSAELTVKSAPAVKFTLRGPGGEIQAGQSSTLHVEAHDKWGNVDAEFSGTVGVTLANGTEVGEVNLAEGRGTIAFSWTKAEPLAVRLRDSAKTGLDASATCSLTYIAGPATRLVIVSPEETTAGQPVKVQVKALDQYGNLATTCNEAIKIEVSSLKVSKNQSAA